ncbi:MAG TPA: MogA/MoaB family molybdenum cofactor biosynthesis protein, partial [Candidatus Limnocylindrales bacterium]|nr:MogA/MoaB family molybdenum cofactor biosynthesis protein [Candidatus Limnocylindrales bacterium]
MDQSSPVPDERRVPIGTRALVLTVSDGVASGTRHDDAGEALASRLERLGFTPRRLSVADDQEAIRIALVSALDEHALVITTGGTGLTPRDVTPQATAAVLDYEVPGLAEAMRAEGRARTPMADLSRGLVGVARRRLVVNVPGSPRAALESLAALEPTLRHALETLAGPFDHGVDGASRPDLPEPDPGMPGAPGAPDAPGAIPGVDEVEAPPHIAPGSGAGASGSSDPWRDLPPSG